jgi:hypothetical protein
MDTEKHSLELLPQDLRERFVAPVRSVTFYCHLFVGVVVFGGLGVYFAIWASHWSMRDTSAALLCYFPALAAAAMLEFDSQAQPYLRSFGIIALVIFIILFVLGILSKAGWQFSWSIVGTFLSILFWWVANGLNNRFHDVKPQSALGPDPAGALSKSSETGWVQ